MELFDFQKQVARHLRAGQNVILQAPTGSGKTIAALWPFLEAWDRKAASFPKQCIYSVPMRVLANQFTAATHKLVCEDMLLMQNPDIQIQTGEHPDDPELHGDLVFTTIDQTLSNVLGVPYALGSGRANLNVGAVVGSYLVFDEFHLYPPDGALKTTLQILKLLNGITPFVLMTATFSSAMLDDLKRELGAEVVTVSPEELQKIPSQQNKVRRYHVVKECLTADAVLARHRTRSIAICNTVERAQALFEQLRDHPERGDAQVVLLHARFTASDRKNKEEFIRTQFGKDKPQWTAPNLILVATQVIEVGLDITCENLHTEITPANAVFQRAGRCARFENEQGDVFIYDVPLNKNGKRNFAPYMGVEAKLCEKAWDAFLKLQDGEPLDFHGEQRVIDEVHTEADRALLDSMRENEGEIWDKIQRAMILNDPTTRRDLIRDSSDSRTVLVHNQPETLDSPYRYRGFSIYIGSLLGKFDELEQWRRERELDWVFKYPEEVEIEDDDARKKIEYVWKKIWDKDLLKLSPLLVVHPAFVEYAEQVGFRFSANGDPTRNDLNERARGGKRDKEFTYQLEDYPHHIREMTRVFESRWRDRLLFAAARLEQAQGWQSGSIERAARLAIACHDVGKLDKRWQKWARNYQTAIHNEGLGELVTDPNFMIAHTRSETDKHREIEKSIMPRRPHHAGEGAIAVAKIANTFFSDSSQAREALRKITLSAIARHHSAQTNSFDEKYHLEDAARDALFAAMQNARVNVGREAMNDLFLRAPQTLLEKQILSGDDTREWWLAYFLIIRALRMSDGESQEEA